METPQRNTRIFTMAVLDLICMSRNTCRKILNRAEEHPWGTLNPWDARAWKHAKSCSCF